MASPWALLQGPRASGGKRGQEVTGADVLANGSRCTADHPLTLAPAQLTILRIYSLLPAPRPAPGKKVRNAPRHDERKRPWKSQRELSHDPESSAARTVPLPRREGRPRDPQRLVREPRFGGEVGGRGLLSPDGSGFPQCRTATPGITGPKQEYLPTGFGEIAGRIIDLATEEFYPSRLGRRPGAGRVWVCRGWGQEETGLETDTDVSQ